MAKGWSSRQFAAAFQVETQAVAAADRKIAQQAAAKKAAEEKELHERELRRLGGGVRRIAGHPGVVYAY